MRSKLVVLASVISLSTFFSLGALANEHEKGEGPCKKVKEACEAAGFVKGEAKQGTGLWVDCIDPIMTGNAQPKSAKKALPQVDAQVVAACKAKHPNFGQPKQNKK